MKATVIPEKIYIPQNYSLESGLEDFYVDHQVFLGEIEYTRTDAFIEKACDAYCKVCGHYAHGVPTHICRHDCRYFSDFKNYMQNEIQD